LIRLGRKTHSRNLHECHNFHELAEGVRMATPHPDHLVLSGECGALKLFAVLFTPAQWHEAHALLPVTPEFLKPSTTLSCLCRLVPFWRSIIYSVQATTTVTDRVSFPYALACASELQEYIMMYHKQPFAVYSWPMAPQTPSHRHSLPRWRPRSQHSRCCQLVSKETHLTFL
jgi:hypothetical protein